MEREEKVGGQSPNPLRWVHTIADVCNFSARFSIFWTLLQKFETRRGVVKLNNM